MTGDELRAELDDLSLTRAALARWCGVEPRTVYRWLNGRLAVPQYAAAIIKLLRDRLVDQSMIEYLTRKLDNRT